MWIEIELWNLKHPTLFLIQWSLSTITETLKGSGMAKVLENHENISCSVSCTNQSSGFIGPQNIVRGYGYEFCVSFCAFLFSKTCSCGLAFSESRRTTVSAKNLPCSTQEKDTYILDFAVYMNFATEDVEVKCYCPMHYPLTSGAGMWICAALRSLIRLSHSLTVNGKQAIFTNTAFVRGQGVWLAHTLMLEC